MSRKPPLSHNSKFDAYCRGRFWTQVSAIDGCRLNWTVLRYWFGTHLPYRAYWNWHDVRAHWGLLLALWLVRGATAWYLWRSVGAWCAGQGIADPLYLGFADAVPLAGATWPAGLAAYVTWGVLRFRRMVVALHIPK